MPRTTRLLKQLVDNNRNFMLDFLGNIAVACVGKHVRFNFGFGTRGANNNLIVTFKLEL